MKKSLALLALVPLLGAGCAGSQSSDDAFVTVGWFHDAFTGNICLDGGTVEIYPVVAEAIGYPNEATDHLCVGNGSELLTGGDVEFEEVGKGTVRLGEIELYSDQENGRIYTVDVLESK